MEIKVSPNTIFDMSIEKAARDYKEFKKDSDFIILYDFLKKMVGVVAFKYRVEKDEDILQNCGIKLIEKIHQFNPDKSAFYNWAYTIVANEYKQSFRHRKYWSENTEIEDVDFEFGFTKTVAYEDPNEFELYDKLDDEDIKEAVLTFNPPSFARGVRNKFLTSENAKAIFFKYIFEEKTLQQVADESGILIGRVKSIVYRYRGYFIEHLKKTYPNRIFPEQHTGKKRTLYK